MIYNKKIAEIYEEVETSENGLSEDKARRRFEANGPNRLEQHKKRSLFLIFLKQFKDPLIYILFIAAVFTFVVDEYIDCGVILAIVMINAVVGFVQEFKAEKSLQAIRNLVSPQTLVLRDGEKKEIDATHVVAGDIVLLRTGDKVPADIRLIEVKDLEINESTFTGEVEPSHKHTDTIAETELSISDQKNMAFMGTVVTHGKGKGIVVATAKDTELGKISEQVSETKKEKTPLQKRLMFFSKIIGLGIVVLCAMILLIGIIQGKSLKEMILFSISIAVGAIPEGLPIVITITMAIGIKRLADRQAIIRKMIAVETLGSCDYICSDKTGTITENSMTVTKAYTPTSSFEFEGTGYQPDGAIKRDKEEIGEDDSLAELLMCGVLCNDSQLSKNDNDEWMIEGDPTEGALLVAAKKYGIAIEEVQRENKLVDELPFKSKRQFMTTLRETDDGSVLYVKGAPEKIMTFSDIKKGEHEEINAQFAREGLRVLAFAKKNIPNTNGKPIDLEQETSSGMTFLGFQGIIDPPRESAITAIKQTKQAGIIPVMITGDQKTTATAIAEKVGIIDDHTEFESIDGQQLEENAESLLDQHVEQIRVYARVSPQHKLQIVEALQNKGHIVAVTGDGVNDAPALKKSNIGVAMGQKGTEVAKEAAEMILIDDNFATIFEAVKGGRVIYENIRKVIYFLLSSATGTVLFIITTLVLKMPLPFLASQILWVNLVTNGLQDVALAYEPGEENIAKQPPRDPDENIINIFVLKRLMIVGVTIMGGAFCVFWYALNSGASIREARTMVFTAVVFFQLFHLFNCRSFERSVFRISLFSNPFLIISILLGFSAQMAVLYYPPLQFIFKTVPLEFNIVIKIMLLGTIIIAVMEIDKWVIRKKKKNAHG